MTRNASIRRALPAGVPAPPLRVRLCVCGSLCLALLAGCGGPFLVFPGGALRGEVARAPVRDWSFASDRFVDLELRPGDPYSVELNYVVRDGRLYIDPAEGRRWFDMLRADPRARVRFGSTIYPVQARLVGRPGELEGFDADRFVYELVWRDDAGGRRSEEAGRASGAGLP